MRNIKFEGVKNTRDLGGIKAKNGIIKSKKMIRGAGLSSLTDKDVEKLVSDYNSFAIIDLRTKEEIFEKPDIEIPNAKYIHMPVLTSEAFGITHEEAARQGIDKEVNLRNFYALAFTDKYIENIRTIIKTILSLEDEDYTVLFHCTEGKDRTGVIAAILLTILGVDRQDIMEDYLYTNKVNGKKANKYYWAIRVLERNKKKAKTVKAMYIADKDYMQAVFDTIDNNWENTEDFIKNGLQIEEDMIKRFRKRVIDIT